MNPVIMVITEGSVSAEEIITNIRKKPIDEDFDVLDPETNFMGYKYDVITKYYTTQVYLCPVTVPLEEFQKNSPMMANVEGILIYFDAKKRDFLDAIPVYGDFVKNQNIECGILLCDKLYDDEKEGITYREAKMKSTFLDLIELQPDDDDDETEDSGNTEEPSFLEPVGYDELAQALKSFIWSNVQNVNNVHGLGGVAAVDPLESLISQLADNSLDESEDYLDEEDVERQMANYEQLLTNLLVFNGMAGTMSRNEKLALAQELAKDLDGIVELDRTGNEDHDSD